MNYGLIVAAGKGVRFGGEKQFLPLNDKPVVYYALKSFQESSMVGEIVLVVAQERIDYARAEIVERFALTKVKNVVPGGERRQDSVFGGLSRLPDTGIVAVHDGARPFVTPRLINDGLKACATHPAVIYGLPIVDTVKKVVHDRVGETLDRSQFYAIQTPQFFDLVLLKTAYREAMNQNFYSTDDAALVERLAKPVIVLPGSPWNIKITTPEDLMRAEALLTKWTE